VPFIPDVHTVLSFLEIIGPYCRLNKRPGPVITEMIDGSGEILEIARRINAELVESDFGNGSCKHVANIPPGKYELRESYQEKKWKYFEHSVSCK
jgi:hypothetical protein